MMKITVLVILLSASVAYAGSHPSWDELATLYGQRIDSTNMISFVQKYELGKIQKFDQGSFRPKDNSFAVMFGRNTIDCIILRVATATWGDRNWTSYALELPFGLLATNTLSQVIAKYGVTNAGPETWFIDDYKVWPHFESGTNKISEIYIWRTTNTNHTPEDTARKLADPQH